MVDSIFSYALESTIPSATKYILSKYLQINTFTDELLINNIDMAISSLTYEKDLPDFDKTSPEILPIDLVDQEEPVNINKLLEDIAEVIIENAIDDNVSLILNDDKVKEKTAGYKYANISVEKIDGKEPIYKKDGNEIATSSVVDLKQLLKDSLIPRVTASRLKPAIGLTTDENFLQLATLAAMEIVGS